MKINFDPLFDYYSRRHYEFTTAWSLVGQAYTLLTFETFAIVFCDKVGISGYLAWTIYAIVPIISVVLIILLGNRMIRSGYASKYSEYGMNVNNDWKNLMDNFCEVTDYIRKEKERKEQIVEESNK